MVLAGSFGTPTRSRNRHVVGTQENTPPRYSMRSLSLVRRGARSAVAFGNRLPPTVLALAMALVALGCGGGGDSTPSAPPPPVMVLTTITVSLSAATIEVGQTATASASGADQIGGPISTGTVTWASSSPTVATITTSGAIIALAAGQTVIKAIVGSKSGSATLNVVAPTFPMVAVLLASDRILEGVTTETARAVLLTAVGDTVIGRPVAWRSSAPSVASIDGAGRIAAVAPGTATLSATIDGKAAGALVTVEPRSRYQTADKGLWWFIDQSDPRMPMKDGSRGGYVPQAADTRRQIIVDETFTVPAGQEVLWENRIVWVRPKQRRTISIYGRLTVRNTLMLWDQTEFQQTGIIVQRGGVLRVENSYAFSSNQFGLNWDFKDGATVILNHYQGTPWTTASGSVNYTAVNATSATVTLFGNTNNASFTVSDAAIVWIEIFPPPGTHEFRLPARYSWHDWNLSSLWPGTSVVVKNSYVYQRDVALNTGTHVTISDTPDGFGLGWTVHKDTPGFIDCEIHNLGTPGDYQTGTFYVNATWNMPCNNSSLTIRNSLLKGSWPNVYGKAHLKVFVSSLVDTRNFGGSGESGNPTTYEVYDSWIYFLAATNGGQMYVENSTIQDFIQVIGLGSIIYSYGLVSTTGAPSPVYQESGGVYVKLATPGKPWP